MRCSQPNATRDNYTVRGWRNHQALQPTVPQHEPWVLAVVATPEDMRVPMTVRFSNQLVAELIQPFWAAWQGGEFLTDASAVAGAHRQRGLAWVRQAGGVRPRRGRGLQGRSLSFGEREEIALGRAGGESVRLISMRLGRSASTISRELARNSDARGAYRATTAHPLAYERASRPKPARLVTKLALRVRVELGLGRRYSPEQIAGRLRGDYPR